MKKEQPRVRFNKMKSANKDVGHYILLSAAVRGMHYNKSVVTNLFNSLVLKGDYSPDERDSLLERLWRVNEDIETSKNPALMSPEMAQQSHRENGKSPAL